VGRFANVSELERAADDLTRNRETSLPLRAHAGAAVLIVNTTGRWQVKHSFKLGPQASA